MQPCYISTSEMHPALDQTGNFEKDLEQADISWFGP